MASDQIKKSDLFEGGLFDDVTKGASEMNKQVKELTESLTQLHVVTRDKLATTNVNTVEDIKTITKASKDLEEQEKSLAKLRQENAKAIQQEQKAERSVIKTIKDERKELSEAAKALDKLNKERAKSAKITADSNSEYKKSVKSLSELKTQLKELEIRGQTSGKLYKALGQEFVVLDAKVRKAEQSVGEFQRNVGNYPQQLKEVTNALIGLEPGTAEFERLSKKAGELKDKISDAKDTVKAFANESKLTTAKTLFGQIGSDLVDLDFKGASDKAKQFAGVIKSISFAEVIGGIKNFGSALSSVFSSLLANQFALTIAGIVALGLAIKETYDAYQRADEIIKDFNESLKKQDEIIIDLNKRLRDAKVEYKLLSKEITASDKDRIDKTNQFKDEFIKIREEERAEIKRLRDATKDANEKTITEYSLGEAGQALYLSRLQSNSIKFAKEEVLIEEKYNERKKALGLLLQQDLKNINAESSNDKADSVKKSAEKELKERDDLSRRLKQAEIDNIKDERLRKEAQLVFNFNNEIEDLEKTTATRKQKNDIIVELNKKLQSDLEALVPQAEKTAKKLTGVLDDSDFKERQRQLEEQAKERLRIAKFIVDEIEKEIKRESDLRQKAIDDRIKDSDKEIERQRALAEKGQTNQLAFEQRNKAKLELAKKQEAEKEIKRLKAVAFIKSYVSYLETTKNPQQAFTNALRDSVLISLVQGAFYDGTENVGDSLGKPLLPGRDGHIVRVDGSERIMTGKQNEMVGGMSNDELALLAKSYHDGVYLPSYMMESPVGTSTASNLHSSAMLNQLMSVNNRLKSLESSIANKRETSVNLDNLGNVIVSEVEKGLRTTTLIKKRKPRI